jgi:hypothetical protein
MERYVMVNSPEKQERWFEEIKLKKTRDGKIRRDELACGTVSFGNNRAGINKSERNM